MNENYAATIDLLFNTQYMCEYLMPYNLFWKKKQITITSYRSQNLFKYTSERFPNSKVYHTYLSSNLNASWSLFSNSISFGSYFGRNNQFLILKALYWWEVLSILSPMRACLLLADHVRMLVSPSVIGQISWETWKVRQFVNTLQRGRGLMME